ncbi:MAG TPA: Calx-beta domain-containing protein [Thermoanaerobaculia bacterium]|nr:Calx-beta domain-containing protein [Thermoanaerobaculia bacterium]
MSIAITRRLAPLFFLLFAGASSFGATFTVTNGGDNGPGSLRQAIIDANATADRDQIVLATDVVLTTPPPAFSAPVDVTGARTGTTSRYRIDGPTLNPAFARLTFEYSASGSTVRSVHFGPNGYAIYSLAPFFTVTDVVAELSVVEVIGENTVIGGPAAADANTLHRLNIGGNGSRVLGSTIGSLYLYAAHDAEIGTATTGNTIGQLVIDSSYLVVVRNNRIETVNAFSIDAVPGFRTFPTIIDNVITTTFGSPAVSLTDLQDGAIIRNNVIRGQRGVAIASSIGVDVTGNSIVATDGSPAIDLSGVGANDPPPDADGGPNGGQNFPQLASASLGSGVLTVDGTLASAPLTPYQIELFSSDAGKRDVRTLLDSFTVTTDGTGHATFTRTITSSLPLPGESITATATNRSTVATPGNFPNSTSSVSLPVPVTGPGVLGFDNGAQAADEGAGNATIIVQRTGGTDGVVTVNYSTTNGTATAPGDFTQTSGTLTFGAGVTTQTIVVPLTNDDAAEGDETFTVTLTNPTGGATIGQPTTFITITDTDAAVDAAPVPTASTWALIAMALGLASIALFRS